MTALDMLQTATTTTPLLVARYGENRKTAGSTKARVSVHGTQLEATIALPVQGQVITLIVQNLASPLNVLKPFEIAIEPIDDGFVASFLEANINASGDSADEALDNLVSIIRDLYELFSDEINQLGPEPARQYSILRTHLSL
jgi:hypothetical protein